MPVQGPMLKTRFRPARHLPASLSKVLKVDAFGAQSFQIRLAEEQA